LLYLDTKEYEEYRKFRWLKRLISNKQLTEATELLSKFEGSVLSKQLFIRQFISFVKIKINGEMSDEETINALHKVIRMSKPKYEECKVAGYRLTSNEISALIEIASRYFSNRQESKAIVLTQAIIESRDRIRASEEDKAIFLPALMSNLSTMLGKVGRYKESLHYCNRAVDISREYNNFRLVPLLLYNAATSHYLLGEEKCVYKTEIIRAYHCAYAMGQYDVAKMIKKSAKAELGFIIRDA